MMYFGDAVNESHSYYDTGLLALGALRSVTASLLSGLIVS